MKKKEIHQAATPEMPGYMLAQELPSLVSRISLGSVSWLKLRSHGVPTRPGLVCVTCLRLACDLSKGEGAS